MNDVTVTVSTLDNGRFAYVVPMSPEAFDALGWIADRYTSAEILWDGSDYDEDTETLTVPEGVAWSYRDALPEDNGVADAALPPCAGGPLADSLLALLDSIV